MAGLKRETKTSLIVGVLVIALLLGALLMGSSRPVSTFAPGKVLMYDDFGFTVLSAEEVDSAERGVSHYRVRVKVENHAKRVNYDFDPSVVSPVTESGGVLTLSDKSALADSSLSPGESASYDLVFVGPSDAKILNVRFRFGGAIGTVMDDLLLGPRQVRVPVP
ncbi:MAG: hypothetical protein JSS66_10320 [Armatimonadetes bacterium]|nr:hypothetical protein [Armatimonadota bacterium]